MAAAGLGSLIAGARETQLLTQPPALNDFLIIVKFGLKICIG